MQHISRQLISEKFVVIHACLSLACEFEGVVKIPCLPLHFGEGVGMMFRDVNQLFSIGVVLLCVFAFIGGVTIDIIT